MQALPANIIELDLALNEVTPEGAQALAVALQRLPHLQRLNLRENELENAGAIAIAKGLAKLKNLRELDLTQNQVLLRSAHDCAQHVVQQITDLNLLDTFRKPTSHMRNIGRDIESGFMHLAGKTCARDNLGVVHKSHAILPMEASSLACRFALTV